MLRPFKTMKNCVQNVETYQLGRIKEMRASKIPARLILKLTKYDGVLAGQYRFNHTDCPAGEDTRERLYIKIPNKQPWTRIAYCHNCGLSGFASLRKNSYDYLRAKHTESVLQGAREEGRSSYKYRLERGERDANSRIQHTGLSPVVFDKLPPAVQARLNHAHIDAERYQRYLLGYNEQLDRITIPYWEYGTDNLLSTQYKAVTPGVVPKFFTEANPEAEYKTDVISKHSMSLTFKGHKKENVEGFSHTTGALSEKQEHILVIVEDYFSAINIAETSDLVHALPLAGVHYNTMQLAEILQRNLYNTIIVWLDNDNGTVLSKATSLARDMEYISGDEIPVHLYLVADEDPKKFQTPELAIKIDELISSGEEE